jgi:hypothetical protein
MTATRQAPAPLLVVLPLPILVEAASSGVSPCICTADFARGCDGKGGRGRDHDVRAVGGGSLCLGSQSLSSLIPEPTKNTTCTHASVLAIAPSSPLLLPCHRPFSPQAAELHPEAPGFRLLASFVHRLLAHTQVQHAQPFSVASQASAWLTWTCASSRAPAAASSSGANP